MGDFLLSSWALAIFLCCPYVVVAHSGYEMKQFPGRVLPNGQVWLHAVVTERVTLLEKQESLCLRQTFLS